MTGRFSGTIISCISKGGGGISGLVDINKHLFVTILHIHIWQIFRQSNLYFILYIRGGGEEEEGLKGWSIIDFNIYVYIYILYSHN
jgi:hypothetical protein